MSKYTPTYDYKSTNQSIFYSIGNGLSPMRNRKIHLSIITWLLFYILPIKFIYRVRHKSVPAVLLSQNCLLLLLIINLL